MRKLIFSLAVTVCLFSSACSAISKGPQPTSQPIKIRIAALRILDTLPIYVAEQEGFFTARGIKVEFIPAASAPERDQLIASGQADGLINEMTSVLFSNRSQVTVQVVRIARAATKDQPVFQVLAGKDSGITKLANLKNKLTGISQGTVIEYLFNRLVEAEGFNTADFPTTNIPSVSDRLALLQSGEVQAAILPDPFSDLAQQNGALDVIDDSSHPEFGYSTLSFRKAFIDQNPAAIKAFLAAWEEAVKAINANPGQWKDVLTQRQIVPAPVAGSYKVPSYVTASVPSEKQFQDALAWAKSKSLLTQDEAYKDCVNDSFLP